MESVQIPVHGCRLLGHLYPPTHPNGFAWLFIQGWQGREYLHTAKTLAAVGFTCLTYNMRGHNGSGGDLLKASRRDFIADTASAYDLLSRQPGVHQIGLIASSFGSYLAILLTQQKPVAALSLRVPATYPDAGFASPQSIQSLDPRLTLWRQTELNWPDNQALRYLHAFTGPVQILAAEHDERLPRQAAQNYARAVAIPAHLDFQIVPRAPHSLSSPALQADYERRLFIWINALSLAGQSSS